MGGTVWLMVGPFVPVLFLKEMKPEGVVVILNWVVSVCLGGTLCEKKVEVPRDVQGRAYVLEFSAGYEMASKDGGGAGKGRLPDLRDHHSRDQPKRYS